MSDELKKFLETTSLKDLLEVATALPPSQRRLLEGHFQTTTPPPSPPTAPPPSAPQRRRVYSVKRFAHEIDVSERTVWRWIKADRIKTVQVSIGRIGIPVAELDRVVAEGVL